MYVCRPIYIFIYLFNYLFKWIRAEWEKNTQTSVEYEPFCKAFYFRRLNLRRLLSVSSCFDCSWKLVWLALCDRPETSHSVEISIDCLVYLFPSLIGDIRAAHVLKMSLLPLSPSCLQSLWWGHITQEAWSQSEHSLSVCVCFIIKDACERGPVLLCMLFVFLPDGLLMTEVITRCPGACSVCFSCVLTAARAHVLCSDTPARVLSNPPKAIDQDLSGRCKGSEWMGVPVWAVRGLARWLGGVLWGKGFPAGSVRWLREQIRTLCSFLSGVEYVVSTLLNSHIFR